MILLTACLMVLAVTASPPPTVHQRPASINYYGKRPQLEASPKVSEEPVVVYAAETWTPSESPKVIIRPASILTTTESAQSNHQLPEDDDSCTCEKMDQCPVEKMDFSFAVSCEYGTVRCCQRREPAVKPPVAKRPKKPAVRCKCKPRKECDALFKNGEEGSADEVDRKDNCPIGSVRCCETGNMGNAKESGSHQDLGSSSQFRPIQLPYLKMPPPSDKRVSETEPVPSPQELQPTEEVVNNTSVPQTLETPAIVQQPVVIQEQTELSPGQQEPQPPTQQVPQLQQPQFVQQFQQPQIRPQALPPQHFQTFGAPPPFRQPLNQPNPNFPIRQTGFQPFQPPQQPIRHAAVPPTPFRQPIPPPPNQIQQNVPQSALLPPPQGFRPAFVPSQPPAFNPPKQQQFGPAPFPQQSFKPPAPQEAQQPAGSNGGGGFFSSLINFFNS